MAFTWTASTGLTAPISEADPVSESVTVAADTSGSTGGTTTTPPYISSYSFDVTVPPQITVSGVGTDTLSITGANFFGLIPYTTTFVNPNTQASVTLNNSFDGPLDSKLVQYVKSSVSPYLVNLSVTATDGTTTETQNYTLTINGEYSAGRDTMLALLPSKDAL